MNSHDRRRTRSHNPSGHCRALARANRSTNLTIRSTESSASSIATTFNFGIRKISLAVPTATDQEIAQVKRSIDKFNQQRNDWIEKIDQWIVEDLGRKSICVEPDAPRNTEMPGSAIDRLSIMSLRLYHLDEQVAADRRRPRVDRLGSGQDIHWPHAAGGFVSIACRASVRRLRRSQTSRHVLPDENVQRPASQSADLQRPPAGRLTVNLDN